MDDYAGWIRDRTERHEWWCDIIVVAKSEDNLSRT